ncbi:MAG TPA: ABC transporter permease [Cyclobacteriaceae bacterium]|nr:ABC transporter permease [Cyclobacteriaceae bacterium]
MVIFILSTKAEFLKIRRSNAFWLTMCGAAFIPLVNAIKLIGRPDVFESKLGNDPWAIFINDNWAVAASFLLPVYVILVISLVVQIEYGNNTWKQVYTTPRSYADIFFSKFLVINFLIIFCFIFFTIFIVASGSAVSLLNHNYEFLSKPVPWGHLIVFTEKMYGSILAMITIQYWLSMQIKNFITPIGLGMVLIIGGYMIRQWEHIAYYPYMHPLLVYFKNPGLKFGSACNALLNSALEGLLFLSGGFYSFCVRNEKG